MKKLNSYYQLKLSPIVGGNLTITALAKSGNHEVFNSVLEHLGCLEVKKLVLPNGMLDLVQYFIVEKNGRCEIPICAFQFTSVDAVYGYGKLQSHVDDAVVVRKNGDDVFEVFISNGNKSMGLQLFRLLVDGKLEDDINTLLNPL